MKADTPKPIMNRPAVVIAGLTILAVLAFLGVTRLVNRFRERQQAVARHLYQRGLSEQQAGKPDLAIEHFRAALLYSRDNFEYQLSLARALRDTGRTEEAEAYLISLWERSPQDGAVNLTLGRLAARQKSLDKILQYYHNTIYGVWASDADQNRLNAWFELIDVLLSQGAVPQAQAELISLAAELPRRPDLQLRVADFFARAQDYEHARAEYEMVLQVDRANPQALAGAGQAAFHLARYREAERYLREAVKVNPHDVASSQLLETSRLVLKADPFARTISETERASRTRAAFEQAGSRLHDCARIKGIDLKIPQSAGSGLPTFEMRWLELKSKITRRRAVNDPGLLNTAMDLVFQIERVTQSECGTPAGVDQALILIDQNRAGVER